MITEPIEAKIKASKVLSVVNTLFSPQEKQKFKDLVQYLERKGEAYVTPHILLDFIQYLALERKDPRAIASLLKLIPQRDRRKLMAIALPFSLFQVDYQTVLNAKHIA